MIGGLRVVVCGYGEVGLRNMLKLQISNYDIESVFDFKNKLNTYL